MKSENEIKKRLEQLTISIALASTKPNDISISEKMKTEEAQRDMLLWVLSNN